MEPEEYQHYIDLVAMKSHAGNGVIRPSNFFPVSFKDGQEVHYKVPVELQREVTLINAEEWIHCLQFLKGKNLTQAEDNEIDIAYYLVDNGVSLSESFLNRYGRREALEKRVQQNNQTTHPIG